jgi:hypothetical protein
VSLVAVRPFAGQLTSHASPVRPEIELQFKRCGVAENIQRANMASKVRYIQEDGTDKVISERDFPMGDLQLETIFLALADWNLGDENGNAIKVTRSNIVKYLEPKEFPWAYKLALEVNPAWAGGDEEDPTLD